MKEIERLCLAVHQSFSAQCTLLWSDEHLLGEAYKQAVYKIQNLKKQFSAFGIECCCRTLEKLWLLYFETISQTT